MENLVQKKKKDQDLHECEVLNSGLGELEESAHAWKNCIKNPGHPSFIPVPDFSLSNLPREFRQTHVLEYVNSVATRTVKLRVGYVSPARPDGYCFASCRGQHIPHFGTGVVSAVVSVRGPTCRCVKCGGTAFLPCQTRYKVILHTAQHVVFDSEEARATQVTLFYDDETCVADGRMKTMWGSTALQSPDGGDVCTLICETYDRDIVKKLETALVTFHQRGGSSFRTTAFPNTDLREICVIVSHPHGQPKKVTVGEEKYRERADSPYGQCYYVYTTDTCPGSSGAFVIRLDLNCTMYLFPDMTWGALHSIGGLDGWLNMSGMCSPDFFHL